MANHSTGSWSFIYFCFFFRNYDPICFVCEKAAKFNKIISCRHVPFPLCQKKPRNPPVAQPKTKQTDYQSFIIVYIFTFCYGIIDSSNVDCYRNMPAFHDSRSQPVILEKWNWNKIQSSAANAPSAEWQKKLFGPFKPATVTANVRAKEIVKFSAQLSIHWLNANATHWHFTWRHYTRTAQPEKCKSEKQMPNEEINRIRKRCRIPCINWSNWIVSGTLAPCD